MKGDENAKGERRQYKHESGKTKTRDEGRESTAHPRLSERMITEQEEGQGAKQDKCAPFGRVGRRKNE